MTVCMLLLQQISRATRNMFSNYSRILFLVLIGLQLGACASYIQSAQQRMSDNLAASILNSDDPETVKQGAPAYLLLVDSFINTEKAEPSAGVLMAASRLYASYAGIFVDEIQRAKRMSNRSLDYALRALCMDMAQACAIREMKFPEFAQLIESTGKDMIDRLFTLGTAWAGWIQTHSDDWNARAELARVSKIIARVVELDDSYGAGSAHLYLGVLNTLLPPALGGKPEVGKSHFEKAIKISTGKNLMASVYLAKYYARLVFDQPLHDRVLNEVIKASPYVEGYTLTNILAQQEARKLLDSAKSYF